MKRNHFPQYRWTRRGNNHHGPSKCHLWKLPRYAIMAVRTIGRLAMPKARHLAALSVFVLGSTIAWSAGLNNEGQNALERCIKDAESAASDALANEYQRHKALIKACNSPHTRNRTTKPNACVSRENRRYQYARNQIQKKKGQARDNCEVYAKCIDTAYRHYFAARKDWKGKLDSKMKQCADRYGQGTKGYQICVDTAKKELAPLLKTVMENYQKDRNNCKRKLAPQFTGEGFERPARRGIQYKGSPRSTPTTEPINTSPVFKQPGSGAQPRN